MRGVTLHLRFSSLSLSLFFLFLFLFFISSKCFGNLLLVLPLLTRIFPAFRSVPHTPHGSLPGTIRQGDERPQTPTMGPHCSKPCRELQRGSRPSPAEPHLPLCFLTHPTAPAWGGGGGVLWVLCASVPVIMMIFSSSSY